MVNNIVSIANQGLCTGCGTCEGLCPEDAVKMTIDQKRGIYTPCVNGDKCTQCGVCLQACPGGKVDFQELIQPVSADSKYDVLIGNYLSCYTGYATNDAIRYKSASGGLVTQLLIFALDKGYIDGALVTRMRKNKPMEPEPFIARTKEEIIEASQSKYCPVSANTALKAILQDNGRYAIVGLPCHLHGIKKAEQINQELKKKIVLHLGIFCLHTPNFWATQTFLHRAKLKPGEVARLNYRGEGWPGGLTVTKTDGSQLFMAQSEFFRKYFASFFIPSRCLMCCDMTAELADLSFGDAWLPEYRNDKVGRSMLVSRSEIGMRLLKKAVDAKVVELVQIDPKLVKRAQVEALYLKKYISKSYIALSRNKPVFRTNLPNPGAIEYLLSLMYHIDRRYSTNSLTRILLKYLPSKLLTGYHLPFSFLMSQQLKKFTQKMAD
jgi:coenzyme F420 hydrogenase subunit beta